ncbi:exodeoxyribonuclease VII large subunit [Polaromonas sp.]|uniref:exodeoxyribonuclease VII large subunit n=1 Tax=Polaromonas sp. TaxID=1869339 RepID=UPI00352A18F5
MPRQYLDVPYKSKDAAKALGARFDGTVKRWYIEAGTDLVAFTLWLPADDAPVPTASTELAFGSVSSTELAAVRKGIPLSRLLSGVGAAVAQAFAAGVWTLVEVNEASVRNGHVYLELSERDSNGQSVAKARGMIWANTATRILPEFEQATGAVIGAGIKLLVRARPVFKAQYGFSLEIDAIDPEYTLGDLEARKKEIRARLQREGVFDRNRRLAPPWDYRLVLVVAPQDAAGLGDFRKEAERLAAFGICRFVYAYSRFQGEGAAREIVAAAMAALQQMGSGARGTGGTADPDEEGNSGEGVGVGEEWGEIPDAIVIIRGGGAVNDLAWLNDYDLARFICDQTIPVLTGIGHERDNTIPDEVAHARFDTPSKVIAGIEQQILRRSREARQAWESILSAGGQAARSTRLTVERKDVQIRADARAHLARARQDSTASLNQIAVSAVHQVHDASRQSLALLNAVRTDATQAIAAARQTVPVLMTSIRAEALASVVEGRATSAMAYNLVVARSTAAARSTGQVLDDRLQRVAERAAGAVQQARTNAQALLREVTGQGPEKTLARGFAVVRTVDGKPVTSSQQARAAAALDIQFRDGSAKVRTDTIAGKKT